MEVSIVFDVAFDGDVGTVVWIIDTPINRNWFNRQKSRDAASAIFSVDRYPTQEAAIAHMIWNVQEHSPAWATINVIGAMLTDRVAADLDGNGHLATTSTGFRLARL